MRTRLLTTFAGLVLAAAAHAQPLSTVFTYQGMLESNGAPASGVYDMRYILFDAAAGGTQLGPTLCTDNVQVVSGRFTAQLDFGSQFSGSQRFLMLQVRADTGLACGDPTGFVTLSPRQSLTASPYAVYSLGATAATTATTAANASQLNSQPASFYTNATNLSSGTIADARLTSNVDLVNATQTIGAPKFFSVAPSFTAVSGPPFTVGSSTQLVANLNADMVDGLNASDLVQVLGTQTIAGNKFFSTAPAFTAVSGPPFTVGSSTQLVTNLNADLLGGLHTSDLVQVLGTQTIAGNKSFSTAPAFTAVSGPPFTVGSSTQLVANLNAELHGGLHTTDLVQTTGNQTIAGTKTFSGPTVLNGFVGIGTTSAIGSANFVMSQNTTSFGGMYINTAGAPGSPFYGYAQNGAPTAFHYVDGLDSDKWKLSLNGGVRLTVTGTGDVGIGTPVPSNRLTVAQESDTSCFLAINSGATAAQSSGLRLNDRNNALWSINKNSSNDFAIREVGPGADRVYIAQGGQVGIGTSSPAAGSKLQVTTSGNFGTAVDGEALGQNGAGVFGFGGGAGATWGVAGQSNGGGSSFGLFSQDRIGAVGTKAFHIDHPLDPQNKYLNHYCEEGPEPLNIYRGTVTLDEQGQATIDLPAYFAEINKDPSYTLTAVGSPMPALYISEEVTENHFSIAGGAPGHKVCWRVEAARNDRFVRTYGAPVEQDKPADLRGTYLTPALYDQPLEKGQSYRSKPPQGPDGH